MTDRATLLAQKPPRLLRWETSFGPAMMQCPADMTLIDLDEFEHAVRLQFSTLRRAAALRALAQEAPGDER